MTTCISHSDPIDHRPPARELFSLLEAVVLASVPEKRVRKDIETGVLTPPCIKRIADAHLCVHWTFVFSLAAVYGNTTLPGKLRKVALSRIDTAFPMSSWAPRILDNGAFARELWAKHTLELDRYLAIDLAKVCETVKPRVSAYIEGLTRVEEKDHVLGGEAVFRGSRLPVKHVGKMIESGESLENVMEDYPYLTEGDILFASLYYRAHPTVGRPRARWGVADAVDDAG